MDYLAVIVGQPLPLLPFSAGKNMTKGKDNGKKHSVRPAPSPSLLRRGLELLFHLHLAPHPVAGAPEDVSYSVGGAAAPCTLRGGGGEGGLHSNFGLTALSLVPTRCGRGLA